MSPIIRIIESTAKDKIFKTYSFGFRGYIYAKTIVSFSLLEPKLSIYVDSRYIINLINRKFLKTQIFEAEIRSINITIRVKKIKSVKYNVSEYVVLQIYFAEKNKIILIRKELYLINDLRTNIFIGNNIIVLEKIVINPASSKIIFGEYKNIVILITITNKANEFIRRIIFFIKTVVILAGVYAAIFIENIKDDLNLSEDRDLFFEPVNLDDLDVYAYIIDLNISEIYIKNNTNRDIILQKRSRLEYITEYDINNFFIVDASEYKLAVRPAKYFDIKKLLETILEIILPIFRNITEY